MKLQNIYRWQCFTPVVISYCVWLYYRFSQVSAKTFRVLVSCQLKIWEEITQIATSA
ncbi:hypothetical protein [Neisseria sp. Ec49-e6-T10]|uniref:hypothetical protein n=1 Tax=Neisseria sp. Ec49-e6-T10 TaxID=3140744 RepID=UPI003EBA62C6